MAAAVKLSQQPRTESCEQPAISAARMAAWRRTTRSATMQPLPHRRAVGFEFYVLAKGESMGPECRLGVKTGSPAWASECPLLGVLRLGKRMKFGGLGWPPR